MSGQPVQYRFRVKRLFFPYFNFSFFSVVIVITFFSFFTMIAVIITIMSVFCMNISIAGMTARVCTIVMAAAVTAVWPANTMIVAI